MFNPNQPTRYVLVPAPTPGGNLFVRQTLTTVSPNAPAVRLTTTGKVYFAFGISTVSANPLSPCLIGSPENPAVAEFALDQTVTTVSFAVDQQATTVCVQQGQNIGPFTPTWPGP